MSLYNLKEKVEIRVDGVITKIDDYFGDKKSSEVLMMALIVPLLLLFLFYQYIIPIKEKETIRAKNEMLRVEAELTKYRQTGQEEVNLLNEQVLALNDEIEKTRELKNYLESSLLSLDAIFFTQKEWTQLLDKTTQEAKKRGVVIEKNQNFISPEGNGLMPMVEVELAGNSEFMPFMRFIHEIEAGKKMIAIEELSMEHKQKQRLGFALKMKLWEIR